MPLPCFLGLLAFLVASGTGLITASAQVLPMDLVFTTDHAASPATMSSTAQGFTLSAAPLASGLFHVPKPEAPIVDAVPAEPEPNPLPAPQPKPVRAVAPPATLTGPLDIKPKPVVSANAGPAAVATVERLSERAIVERANSYFTHLTTMISEFTQVGGNGGRMRGTLYLQRPGKVRFDYEAPATLEVIADGSSVAVRDAKLATQDLYSISQTPLKFLLRERVNLGQDITITDVESDEDSARITLEDKSTLGGTSYIVLYFDPAVQTLTQWRIIDAQGFQTAVILNKTQRGRAIDDSVFTIQYERILGSNK